jgi:lipoprotein NlpD
MKLDDDAGEMQRMKIVLSGQSAPTSRAAMLSLLVVLLLSACASPGHRAPVDERRVAPGAGPLATTAPPQPDDGSAMAAQALPGSENAGKPGYYTVKLGDTLLRIALEAGQNWRDVARWSQLANPNVIEVGQVLRVVPPVPEVAPPMSTAVAGAGAAATRPVAPANRGDARPLDGTTAFPVVPGASAGAPGAAPAASTPAPALSPEEDLNWMWPAAGPVVTGFDDLKSKGLAISGNAGDPVLAAADGRVVYAGSGLRGYGNLVIVKHNNTFLTAYAHNQTLLVKEDQVVRRGQQIAEMGNSDAERVQLHFEIRRQGRPIDPARLLPPR